MRLKKQDRSKSRPERLIAYCGLYCGDCPRYGNSTSRLAQELRRKLEASGFARAARTRTARASGYKGFPAFWEMLGMIAGFECPGCRKVGCSVTCRIRPCCIKRGFSGCWECAEFASCPEFRWLRKVHGKGIAHNLRVLARKGPKEFVRGKRHWLKTIRSQSSKLKSRRRGSEREVRNQKAEARRQNREPNSNFGLAFSRGAFVLEY